MSKHIFAVHDPGAWFGFVREAGREAWCVYTESIGHDPNDRSGGNFEQPGITPIVRLNNAYGSGGTIPLPRDHAAFAQRCANYVQASKGIQYVIIGNEPQMKWDWPEGQPITLDHYIACYLQCYDAIKRVAPGIKVGPAAVATWNNGITYPGNTRGDWVKLQADIWTRTGGKIDAIYIHTYSHGYNPALVTDQTKMGEPFGDRFFNFQTYRQFMAAIPTNFRHLPVFITEMNGDGSWPGHNSQWVQAAYAEIDRWNQVGTHQQILAAALFRWAAHDQKWDISRHAGSVDDFRQALRHEYRHRFGVVSERPASPIFLGVVTVLAEAGLRLRDRPRDGTILKTLPYGTIVEVMADNRDGWCLVRAGDQQGWAASEYLGAPVPGSAPAAPKPTVLQAKTKVNVRDKASLAGKVIFRLDEDEVVETDGAEVEAESLRWVKVRNGWAALFAPNGTWLLGAVPATMEERIVDFIMRAEGGVSNDPNDRGGLTKYGISSLAYPRLDIAKLSFTEAVALCRTDYIKASGALDLAWPLSLMHADAAFNQGKGAAAKFLAGAGGDYGRYKALRKDYYRALTGKDYQHSAWRDRLERLERYVQTTGVLGA